MTLDVLTYCLQCDSAVNRVTSVQSDYILVSISPVCYSTKLLPVKC